MSRKNKNTFMQMLPYIILVGVIICVLFLYGGTQTKIYELNTGELLNLVIKLIIMVLLLKKL